MFSKARRGARGHGGHGERSRKSPCSPCPRVPRRAFLLWRDKNETLRACMPGAFLCRPRRVLATACVAGESSGSLSPSRHPIGPGSRPRPTVQSTLWWNVAAGRRTRHLRASHSSHLERTGIDPQPAWGVVEALPSLCESTVGFFVGFRHRGKPYTRKTQKPEPRTQKLISL